MRLEEIHRDQLMPMMLQSYPCHTEYWW